MSEDRIEGVVFGFDSYNGVGVIESPETPGGC
jgi:hypothetical protein